METAGPASLSRSQTRFFSSCRCRHLPGLRSVWHLPHFWVTGHHLYGVAGPAAGEMWGLFHVHSQGGGTHWQFFHDALCVCVFVSHGMLGKCLSWDAYLIAFIVLLLHCLN